MTRRLVKHQRTRVLFNQKSDNPYWDWVYRTGFATPVGYGHAENVHEPKQANPDSLTEDQGMYSLTRQQLRIQERVQRLLKRSPQFLTEKQYQVFVLVTEGVALRAIARKLGRRVQTIHEVWKAAQTKLLKEYQKDDEDN
jgi:DNA-directed RNA polymerase specialized sigma24 family protein